MTQFEYSITALREHFAKSMTFLSDDEGERYRAVRGCDPDGGSVLGVYDTRYKFFVFKTVSSSVGDECAQQLAVEVAKRMQGVSAGQSLAQTPAHYSSDEPSVTRRYYSATFGGAFMDVTWSDLYDGREGTGDPILIGHAEARSDDVHAVEDIVTFVRSLTEALNREPLTWQPPSARLDEG